MCNRGVIFRIVILRDSGLYNATKQCQRTLVEQIKHTHTHTHSTCVGMTWLGLWEASETENLWALPKRVGVKTQSFITTAHMASVGEGPAKLRPRVLS